MDIIQGFFDWLGSVVIGPFFNGMHALWSLVFDSISLLVSYFNSSADVFTTFMQIFNTIPVPIRDFFYLTFMVTTLFAFTNMIIRRG